MKLFIIASLLVSGGGVTMFSDNDVTEDIKESKDKYIERFKQRENRMMNIKETGLEYPNQQFLDQFTDEEQVVILSTIDQLNVDYDFKTMTDEQLKETLHEIKQELEELYEDYGFIHKETKGNWKHHKHNIEEHINTVKESGIPYPNENFSNLLTEEQLESITSKIDEVNAQYDFSSMTDEELRETLGSINQELKDLYNDLELFPKNPHTNKNQ